LLVDINNVDGAFLNSQERLAQAMVTLVEKSGSTMLSYHCHKLDPIGVSCVGVLLESHISFHTWPEASGVITLDIFTCGKTRLLPLLSVVESLFGIPQSPLLEPPILQWSLKYRGYPRGGEERNPEEVDLDQFMLGWSEYPIKERISEVQSDFQFIEIYDVINPRFRTVESHKRSLANDGSYESLNSDLFLLDRVVYLDKIMQSRRFGEKEYHEALVHPAMFAHENPKRVAIIGGGEGATLREVLKHRTVEQVTMIEIDEVMVSVSRRYIPEWSTCRDIAGGTDSCFDDPRASVLYSDAVAWFKDKFGGDATVRDDELFDVIIMDAL
jgi:spermidine synthase